jgi:hypothetical protein
MSRVTLAVVFALGLFGSGAMAGAQLRGVTPIPEPRVLSGDDIGFRVEGRQGDSLVGRFVVKVNGQWVEPKVSLGVPRVASVEP